MRATSPAAVIDRAELFSRRAHQALERAVADLERASRAREADDQLRIAFALARSALRKLEESRR